MRANSAARVVKSHFRRVMKNIRTPGSADSNGRPQPLDRDARHRATRRDARPARENDAR